MALDLTALRADFALVAADWNDSIVISRATPSYDANGTETLAYANVETVTGAAHPARVTDKERFTRMEKGADGIPSHRLFVPNGSDIQERDRVVFDGTTCTVLSVDKFEPHYQVWVRE